ncbi:SpoIVB peptidase [Natranaerobius trueperi]|uniref:SpoIVB peptidase n=1 Tax=Natranaerobius trueperi TaxID=759412 RepID=A0A226BY97_9FIRM|nr:SpoIVB peptidase [Natranaerobius trueperi]OWZ84008.1 SpoIVB peptidase [Natranaerobius trueperi]
MKSNKRKLTGICLALTILFIGFSSPVQNYANIPDEIRILENDHYEIQPSLPIKIYVTSGQNEQVLSLNGNETLAEDLVEVNLGKPLKIEPKDIGEVTVEFRLFGYVPLRSMEVNIVPDRDLIPGGESIGIRSGAGEVIVTDHYFLQTQNGELSPAKEAGIKAGDSIVKVDGQKIRDIDKTSKILENTLEESSSINITVRRNNEFKKTTVESRYCNELQKKSIGLYLADSSLGVGTLTYIDKKNNTFGALGHSVSDFTNRDGSFRDGRIVNARIVDIEEGKSGKPGQKRGVFVEEDQPYGKVEKNTDFGIFGQIEDEQVDTTSVNKKSIGLIDHVDEGEAEILTVLEDDKVERFDIEIKRLMPQNSASGKGMVIEVTDEELKEETGGIIQGMSGSPIIQEDRIVGAVTHVFVNEPTKGYGIFLEWMLYEAER